MQSALLRTATFVATVVPRRGVRHPIRSWPTDYLPFPWRYPKKNDFIKQSGDKKDLARVDLFHTPRGDFALLPEYKDAPEEIQRLCSIAFGSDVERHQFRAAKYRELVERHPYDTDSHEVRIGVLTSCIRDQKRRYRKGRNIRDGDMKSRLYFRVLSRTKCLNQLAIAHGERYRLVKEILGIKHELCPLNSYPEKTSKKGDIRQRATAWAAKLKEKRMEECHQKLLSMQGAFEEEKKATLEWIAKEIQELELSEEEINALEYKGILDK